MTDVHTDPGRSAIASTFQHEALLYSGAHQFVEGAMGFVRSALTSDEAVLIAVIEPRASMLREELGPDAAHVDFLDMAEVGRNPARIIPAWQDHVERHVTLGRGFRGIGEPIWTGRSADEIVECQQHEQLLNTAFEDGPGWRLLCPYDVANLADEVIARAHDTHPTLLDAEARFPSTSYPHPDLSHDSMFASPLPDPAERWVQGEEGPVERRPFGREDLADLRQWVSGHATPLMGRRRADDLVIVINELANNSILYGGGRGTANLWREPGKLVCEVRDAGLITDPLIGRRRPPGSAEGGAGVWMVNQLCDLVQIRSVAGEGTVVRVHMGLSPDGAL